MILVTGPHDFACEIFFNWSSTEIIKNNLFLKLSDLFIKKKVFRDLFHLVATSQSTTLEDH